MRPVRLELEGFTAFRAPTVVDFEGADLFALTGATGSGKTSILDGMVFALYGNVPRLADQRTVVPVIAQGMAEARVRLDFTIGADTYTATRIVRRTKGGGGNTAEARLESGGEVLAGTADEVTAAVTERLGLSYEHFTKCVVLPQGEFARFLHDKPAARQDLLMSLLDLGVYAQMASLASERASKAKADASVLEGRLRDAAHATPEAVAGAVARVDELSTLVAELDAATPQLAALQADADAIGAEAARIVEEAELLGAVVVPVGLEAVHDRLAAATGMLEAVGAEVAVAETAVTTAEGVLVGLGDRADLVRLLDAHDRRSALGERRVKGEVVVVERRADAAKVAEALAAVTIVLETTRVEEEAIAAAHRAHAVRADLVAGADCPVCLQTVAVVPRSKAPAAISKAKATREKVERELRAATEAQSAADKALGIAEAALASLDVDLTEVNALLDGKPERAEVQRVIEAHSNATADLETCRRSLAEARTRHADALADRDAATGAEHAARAAYDDARDALAALKPPSRRRATVTLLDEWTALVEWAGREGAARKTAVDELEGKAAAIAKQLTDRIADLAAEVCERRPRRAEGHRSRGGGAGGARPRQCRSRDAGRLAAAEAERMRADLVAVEAQRELAHGLALHLNATHFEKWLLDEAMTALAEGATDLLRTLSGDQYSLRVDPKNGNFVVVDHRNADEIRSARTLVGGRDVSCLAGPRPRAGRSHRDARGPRRGSARIDLSRRGLRHARSRHARCRRLGHRRARGQRATGRRRQPRGRARRATARAVRGPSVG